MIAQVKAYYDGEVLRLKEPIDLEPNTDVFLTISNIEPEPQEPYAFLHTALSLHLQGPTDWSERYEDYLYGELTNGYE